MVQLKMLQMTSKQAEQRITIQCRNLAVSPIFTGFRRGTLLELEGDFAPQVIRNECSVRPWSSYTSNRFTNSVLLSTHS